MGNLSDLDRDLGDLQNVAPELRSERAAELLAVTGFMADEMANDTGSVVLGVNQGVVDEFIASRRRILQATANGNWDSVAGDIQSQNYARQSNQLGEVQTAMNCDDGSQEQGQKQRPNQLSSLQALTVVGVGKSPGRDDFKAMAEIALISAVVMVGMYFGTLFITKKIKKGRRYRRHYCQIDGQLEFRDKVLPVQVVEVSRKGAKITASDLPDPKTPVVLTMPDNTVKAHIVWSNANYAGLSFDRLIKVRIEEPADFEVDLTAPPDNPANSSP